jgi:hypothetical protein
MNALVALFVARITTTISTILVFKHKGLSFSFFNDHIDFSVLYRQPIETNLANTEKKEMFFDPNTLRENGTAALNTYSFSESGNYFAYGISYSGIVLIHC